MISSLETQRLATTPGIWPAVGAMAALQAIVSLAIFAPGVLAPLYGVDAPALGLFMAAMFGVCTVTTIWGGVLSARFGSMRIASFCMVAVAVSMMAAAILPPAH